METRTLDQHSDAQPAERGAQGRALSIGLWSAGAVGFFAAGALLWTRYGENVFADIVAAGLAWCM